LVLLKNLLFSETGMGRRPTKDVFVASFVLSFVELEPGDAQGYGAGQA
jgi:hypothetical protein